jgi:y4mF family transcriptional regulator
MPDNRRRSQNQIKESAGPIGSFVREQRKVLGYTQAEFAQRVGVGLRFLKDLELGKKTVRLDKVNQVLNYLGSEAVPGPMTKEED